MAKAIDTLVELGAKTRPAKFFIEFELPLLRKPLDQNGRRWPHIEIGGDCLRIGKTTTKQVLVEQIGKRGLPFVFSDEDWKANKYLKDQYKGLTDSLLSSQKWFAQKKKLQLKSIPDNSFWIQVVNPEMDFGYCMTNYLVGRLSRRQFLDYWQFYQSLGWEKVPAPDLLVYLTARPETLIARFKMSARDFEKVDNEYIKIMQYVNQFWLKLAQRCMDVLVIKTDAFDFSYDSGTAAARDKLGEMFFAALAREGWKY